ncbi:MAG: alpha/beta fold hydrolase [Methanobacteriota archaeon]
MLAHVERGGRGKPPVLLLHGWPLNRRIWDEVLVAVSRAGFRVLAPDLPGFGESPPIDPSRETVEAYADEVASFLRTIAPGRVAFAGHSFGGYIALAFAERHPRLVAGLALVSSRTNADSDVARRGREEAIGKVRAQGPASLLPGLAERLLGPDAGPDLRRAATGMIEDARRDGVVAGLRAMAARPDRSAVLASLRGPLLVLHGAADALIPVTEVATPAHPRGPVTVTILPGVGHMPMWEAPEATAHALVAWAEAAHRPRAPSRPVEPRRKV